MRARIIAGNWKMNGTIAETEKLLAELKTKLPAEALSITVVCPPFTALYVAAMLLGGGSIKLGAQDLSPYSKGAYTGDISADMLLTVGVSYVILGHSERRQYYAESDDFINAKVKAALKAGLTPILCIGETLDQREGSQTEAVVGRQLEGALSGLSQLEIKKLVIAYEPVWAIGTGKTASPEMAQEVHKFIRNRLAVHDKATAEMVPILYGGSVKGDNAAGLLSQPDIDGALVGGASLKADEFVQIIESV